MLLLASSEIIGMEELAETLQSDASGEEKTSFLIEYLMSQRGVVLDALKTLLFALVVYLVGRRLVRLALRLTEKWMVRREVEISVRKFVMSFAGVIYHLVLIFIIAWILGIGATIVAVVGSAGLAVGLALQGSLSNLAGGVLILLLKPFQVGDYILVSGEEGTVQSIDIFYTRLSTTDNKIVVIPNGSITSDNITNTTNADRRMLILDFYVAYNTDTERVRKLLEWEMDKEERILEEGKAVVIARLTPLRVHMQLKAWTPTDNYWPVRYDMLEKIKQVLQENGIELL